MSLAYPGGPVSQVLVIYNSASITTYNATINELQQQQFSDAERRDAEQQLADRQPADLRLPQPHAEQRQYSLATNIYTCQVVVSNPSNSADEVTVSVTLTVNGGGTSGGGFSLSPSA